MQGYTEPLLDAWHLPPTAHLGPSNHVAPTEHLGLGPSNVTLFGPAPVAVRLCYIDLCCHVATMLRFIDLPATLSACGVRSDKPVQLFSTIMLWV